MYGNTSIYVVYWACVAMVTPKIRLCTEILVYMLYSSIYVVWTCNIRFLYNPNYIHNYIFTAKLP